MAPDHTAIEGITSNPPIIERRGLDAAVIALIKQLHEQFVEAHAHVHDTFVESHEREHNLRNDATQDALRLSAEKLKEETGHLRTDLSHLKDYYDGILSERDHRYAVSEEANQRAIQAAFVAAEKAVDAALDAKEKSVAAAFESAEKAIAKAETSIEKRADATYVSLTELQRNLGQLMPRQEAENRFAANRALIEELRDRVKGMEAIKQGGREAVSNMQMLLGIIIALIVIGGYLSTRIG